MILQNVLRSLVLIPALFVSAAAFAQTPVDDLAPLPIAPSPEQIIPLSLLSPTPPPTPQQPAQRRQLPVRLIPLSAEELSYREAVRALGVNRNRFVHCDLPHGRVRTGVITEIRDDGFTLKDGILISQWIPYSDLKAAPRPVQAVGTRIAQGFKWAGFVAAIIVLLPLFPLLAVAFSDC